MTDINLLKYINLSHSEIYQTEHGEIEQTQENAENKSLVGFKIPTSFLFAGIGLSLTLAVAVVIYFGFFQKDSPVDNMTSDDNAMLDNMTLSDNATPRFSKTFAKVGSITFKDKDTPPPSLPKKELKKTTVTPKKMEIKKQQTEKKVKMPPVKTITLSENIKKKPQVKSVKAPVTLHYALFEDISRQELIQLKKKIKSKKLSYSVSKTKLRTHTVWQLYRQDPTGTKKIADRSVIFIKNFNEKDNAVKYAKRHTIPAIIISKEIEERYYFINVYPFSSQKNAISFSKSTAFPKKSVKIIKGQP